MTDIEIGFIFNELLEIEYSVKFMWWSTEAKYEELLKQIPLE